MSGAQNKKGQVVSGESKEADKDLNAILKALGQESNQKSLGDFKQVDNTICACEWTARGKEGRGDETEGSCITPDDRKMSP